MPSEIHLGGTNKVNPDSPDVRRAIESSVRIQSTPGDGSKYSESGNLVDLSADQLKRLGLKSTDQVVLTDAHGVLNAKGEIMVEGSNDQWYAARLVKLDDVRDLAYLKVENLAPGVLPHVTIADKDETTPGDYVFSVGHNGSEQAISVNGGVYYGQTTKGDELDRLGAGYKAGYLGIVNSKLSKPDQDDALKDFNRPLLQTGLKNVEGNSGGGLFNSRGQIIGVLETVEDSKATAGKGRDMYTPLRQIQAFDAEAQKFNFHYGSQAFKFTGTAQSVYVPALISIDRANGDPRPPFSVSNLIESHYAKPTTKP